MHATLLSPNLSDKVCLLGKAGPFRWCLTPSTAMEPGGVAAVEGTEVEAATAKTSTILLVVVMAMVGEKVLVLLLPEL